MKLVINNQITKKLEKLNNNRLTQKTLNLLKLIESYDDISQITNTQKVYKLSSSLVNYYIGRVTLDYRVILTFDNALSTWIAIDLLNYDEIKKIK